MGVMAITVIIKQYLNEMKRSEQSLDFMEFMISRAILLRQLLTQLRL